MPDEVPCWVTVRALPAIVIAALLELALVLAATEYRTVPLPEPLLPDVTVSHDAPLVAVQEHPACVVRVIDPVLADEV